MIDRKLNIFIASSSAYVNRSSNGEILHDETRKGKLRNLLDCIEEAGHFPIPWWSEEYVSGNVIENILGSISTCDLGIFIFGEDVTITELTPASATHVPNSNVLVEAGIFYALKGRKNTITIIDEKYENSIQIPSDLKGNIFPKLTETKKLCDALKLISKDDNYGDIYDKIIFYRGEDLTKSIIEKKYKEWGSKGLYINTESAIIWEDIEGKIEDENIDMIWKFLSEAIKDKKCGLDDIQNLISLGSGSGDTDEHITTNLKNEHNDSVCYIPIDLNPIMAFKAASKVKVPTPFTIIDDFEGECKHIHRILRDKTHKKRQSDLFIMSGLTFSNLAGKETSFIANMKKIMCPGDHFLFSVSLINQNENPKQSIQKLLTELKSDFTREGPYKDLLINSIIKKYYDLKKDKNFITELRNDFANRIKICEVTDGLKKKKYTSIANTVVIECLYKKSKFSKPIETPLLVSKRYSYNDLKKKMEFSFEEENVRSKEIPSENRKRKAFFLVKR